VRQAHCVALHAGGIRVEPGWVVGVLLAAALLSTRIVAVSTSGSAAPTVPSIEPNLARFYAAASSLPIVSADPAGESSGDASGGVTHSASPAVAAATPRPKATPRPTAAPRPKATPRPTAAPVKKPAAQATAAPTPRPKATPRPTAAPVKKPAAQATAAPTPRPAPTPKPTPAIVYQYQATGLATWGDFGGAVITRLPPGTSIRICGSLGCWEGVSSGNGPSAGGGNLVDLDAAVFQRVCGPLGTGVGSIVLSWR
jgi:outer membrane biosynthesis protein TonB